MLMLLFMSSSVSFDVILCACVCVYMMNECFLYEFALKISDSAFSYYTRPPEDSNVAAANIDS